MRWYSVDKDGQERDFAEKPERSGEKWQFPLMLMINRKKSKNCEIEYLMRKLPNGTIKKLIGRTLSWQDEPVELEEETTEGGTR